MERKQAEAAAEAILGPHIRAQDAKSQELRAKRDAEHALQVRKRRGAWFVLAGAAIGVAIAHFGGFRFTQGICWGGIAGAALGFIVTRRSA